MIYKIKMRKIRLSTFGSDSLIDGEGVVWENDPSLPGNPSATEVTQWVILIWEAPELNNQEDTHIMGAIDIETKLSATVQTWSILSPTQN